MDDEMILDLYFARDELAVVETDRKYGGYCFTIANSILNNTEDAEETVSDTYLRAWNTIPPKRPNVFQMFLAKITRNLAFSRWRNQSAEKRGGGALSRILYLCICVSKYYFRFFRTAAAFFGGGVLPPSSATTAASGFLIIWFCELCNHRQRNVYNCQNN